MKMSSDVRRLLARPQRRLPFALRCFAIACTVILFIALLSTPTTAQTDDRSRSSGMLKKLSLEELTNIEITSVSRKAEKLFSAASAIYVITREEIRRSGATSIPEALRLAPNLLVAQVDSRQWAISARGLNNTLANKLLVMIDGRSIYTPLYSGVFWDAQDVLLEDIERIEVISGPGGTLWGANAVNGVINIITRSAKETKGFFLTGGGGNELRGFGGIRFGGALTKNLSYRVYSKYFSRDSSVFAAGKSANDQWRVGQGGFRADWEASPADLFTLQGDLYNGGVAQLSAQDVFIAGGNLLGRWSHTMSKDSNFSLQLYYDQTRRHIPGVFGEHLDTYDIDSQHRFHAGERHDIVWGLGYRLTEDKVTNISGVAFLPPRFSRQHFSAFVQDEMTLAKEKARLTIGSKFEHNDYTGFEYQPNLRLSWTPSERQVLWGAVSRAIRSPSRIDQVFSPAAPPYLLQGGPDFKSEVLIAYEIGYRVQADRNLSISLATFYNDYNRIRTLEPIPRPPGYPQNLIGPFVIANGHKGEVYGVETTAAYRVREWWQCRAGYTYLQKHFSLRPGSMDFSFGAREGNDPKHQFSFRSSMDLPGRLELNGGLRYVGDLPSPLVPSYAELDARLGWHPGKHFELSVVGQNLLHNHHPEFGAVTNRREIQRSIYGNVSWRF
jgi:iron complex outermembrane recepter protein